MAFWKSVGNALKAPLKPINKAVGKVPGMSALANKTPGLNKISKPLGIGPTAPPPQQASPQPVPPPVGYDGNAPAPMPQLPSMQDSGGQMQGGMGQQMGQGMNPRMGMFQRMMQMRRGMGGMRPQGGGYMSPSLSQRMMQEPLPEGYQPPPYNPNQMMT